MNQETMTPSKYYKELIIELLDKLDERYLCRVYTIIKTHLERPV